MAHCPPRPGPQQEGPRAPRHGTHGLQPAGPSRRGALRGRERSAGRCPWTSAPSAARRATAAAGAPPRGGWGRLCGPGPRAPPNAEAKRRGLDSQQLRKASPPWSAQCRPQRAAEAGCKVAWTATATPNQRPDCQDPSHHGNTRHSRSPGARAEPWARLGQCTRLGAHEPGSRPGPPAGPPAGTAMLPEPSDTARPGCVQSETTPPLAP